MIDETDRHILNILQKNARTPNAEIARQIGMAPSAVLERIRKLETRGVIQGYEARLSPEALGLDLLAYVFVRSEERAGEKQTGDLLAQMPEVQEVHHIAGEDCYLAKIRVPDPKSLARLLRESFGTIGSLRSTRSTIVLETLRESAQLPLFPAGTEVPAVEGALELEEVSLD
jgi:Lrp/AsnC family transcriptional regulator, leucine-responsive regulatory protein